MFYISFAKLAPIHICINRNIWHYLFSKLFRNISANHCAFRNNLVDSASSHTLVSKIKPCMCKYKILYRNCGRLIISVIVYLIIPHYLDNRSNSRANTCIKAELSGTAVFISIKPSLFGVDLVSHNNLSNCMPTWRQWIIQVSALSAWDGSVLDYHGFNG